MNKAAHPFGGRPDEELTDREWRAVTSWRLDQFEKKLDNQTKALWSVAGSILVGIIVYLVTVVLAGGPP